jgi:hypothetical protein
VGSSFLEEQDAVRARAQSAQLDPPIWRRFHPNFSMLQDPARREQRGAPLRVALIRGSGEQTRNHAVVDFLAFEGNMQEDTRLAVEHHENFVSIRSRSFYQLRCVGGRHHEEVVGVRVSNSDREPAIVCRSSMDSQKGEVTLLDQGAQHEKAAESSRVPNAAGNRDDRCARDRDAHAIDHATGDAGEGWQGEMDLPALSGCEIQELGRHLDSPWTKRHENSVRPRRKSGDNVAACCVAGGPGCRMQRSLGARAKN